MRYKRHGIWLAAVIVTGVVLAVTAKSGGLDDPTKLTPVLGFGVSVIGLAANLIRTSPADGAGPAPAERLDRYCDQLATAVGRQWQTEWRLRRLQDPDPLQVPWTLAEPWLADHWDSANSQPVLEGRLENIVAVFERVPSKRLVVLGAAGSGKTVLAVRFTLDVLRDRQPGQAVPVIFSLSSWRPDRESLHGWMTASLAATYPGATWGGELLAAGRVLPVLDGLDEIPGPLRAQAVHRLNAELDPGAPIFLTCRTEVYAEEVEAGDVFTAAAVVELKPLCFEDTSAYLIRTAHPVRGSDGQRTTRWDPVLARLRAHPDDAPGQALRQVLGTPLMVAMARSVYGETTADPAGLLDPRFTDSAAIEQHLLDAFVPAAFRDAPHAEQAGRWLGFLATHLEQQHTRDLAWWQLRGALPWPLRGLGPILLLGSVAMVLSLVLAKTVGVVAPILTAAFLAGVSIGYLILAHRPTPKAPRTSAHHRRVPRETILALAVVACLSAVAGSTGALSFPWGTLTPLAGSGWINPVALAMIAGVAAAMVLAVIGITGVPLPSTTSFGRNRRTSSPFRRALSTASLLLFGCAAGLMAAVSFNSRLFEPLIITLVAAVGIGALSGVLAVPAWWASRHATATGPRVAVPDSRPRHRLGRALGRGVTVGLLAGLCLGATFGLTDATTLAIRADIQGTFPDGAVVHTLADGTQYADTPNGWRHGRLPDGSKYVRTPGAVHGFIAHAPDGSRLAVTASSARDWDCADRRRCTPFYGPVEIHLHRDTYDNEKVKLPNGTSIDDYDFQNELPARTEQWLYQGRAGRLFSDATGLGLGAGLALGVISGIAAGLHRWLIAPLDVARALSPIDSLRTDRTTAAARSIIVYFFGIIATGSLAALLNSPGLPGSDNFYYALIIWVLVGPLALVLSAWGWLLTARLWLCGTGRLPWRVMAFLEEAHKRGVLRQVGAVYQFRHVRLQEQLALGRRPVHDPGQ